MKTRNNSFPANAKSVDDISAMVQDYLLNCGVERGICLRMRLVVEEMLIPLLGKSSQDTEWNVILSKKLRKPWITLTYGGEKFDPTEIQDPVSEMILTQLGIKPKWSYRSGSNRITLGVPSTGIRTEFQLLAAVILAILLGACASFIPTWIKEGVTLLLLTPISDIFMKLLMTLAPMLIFLSVINSIIRTGQGADFGRLGKYVITRFLLVTALMTFVFTFVLIPFFHLNSQAAVSTSFSFQKLYELLIGIVPGNIILPFSENNTMQIIILALFLGVVIINLDSQLETLRSTIMDLYAVFLSGIEVICTVLPLFVFASLLKLFWETGLSEFTKMWKPVLAAGIVQYLFVLIVGILVSLKFRMSVITLFKKIFPVFLIGITTSSSLVAMMTGLEINKNRMGISESYTNLAYPLGLNLNVAVFAPLYLSIAYYLTEIYQVAVSPTWFITAGIICTILSVATPPVIGGALICLGIIMGQLNIPASGLAIAGTLALILDFITTGAKILALHLEMILQAGHLQMIDKEILRDPGKMG